MEFPKATQNLLNLLTAVTDAAAQAEMLCQFTVEDWDELLAMAARQDVTLLLYERLRVAELKALVPARISLQLRESYMAATARNMRMLHHATKILSALKARGIEVIVLKGLYLVENVYASIGLRTFGDLDLMVRKERLAEALAVMQGLGYALSTWYDPNVQNTDIKHLPPLQKTDAPTVELHWTILEEDEPFTIDFEKLWHRAVPVTAAGVKALALGLEDLILHLSLHFTYQHRLRAGLRNLFDIAVVLQKYQGQVDWQQLVQTARQWGALRVTWLTFRLLDELTGVEAPAEVMEAVQPDIVEESVVAGAIDQVLAADNAGVALTPDLADLPASGFGAKLRLVWSRIFLPRRLLAREYNIDPGSIKIFLYYFIRLRDLWRRYARSGWRLMTGEVDALAGAEQERVNANLREWMTRSTSEVDLRPRGFV